eukprot:1944164-Ditylum_brightwellii.AAC.2
MSNRQGSYQPGHGGRGGRGGQGGQPNLRMSKKKGIEDYTFYVGTSKHASDYKITLEFVINHVKKTFTRGNDIAEALCTFVKPDPETWKPTLQISSKAGDTEKRENKQHKMVHKAELDEALKRKRILEDNTFKAYVLLWECCANSMQNKITARTDYNTTIYNDPIKLLQAIKEHSSNYQ